MLPNSSACPDDNRAEAEEPWERKSSFVRTPVWKAKQRERMSPSSNLDALLMPPTGGVQLGCLEALLDAEGRKKRG